MPSLAFHIKASARSAVPHRTESRASWAVGVAASVAVSTGVLCAPALAASVEFKGLADGAAVSSPAHLQFTVEGMEVKPASAGLEDSSGHFHVLIDSEDYPAGKVIQFDETHLHYGKGQQEADVKLPPGEHTLTLQFANAVHESYGPELRSKVKLVAE